MVEAGWQMTTRNIPVLVKGQTKWILITKWFHPEKHKALVSFTDAFNIEFPTTAAPKFNF